MTHTHTLQVSHVINLIYPKWLASEIATVATCKCRLIKYHTDIEV